MNKDLLEGGYIDACMEDAFDAYRDAQKLKHVTNASDAKKLGARIALSLEVSLGKLARYGIHAPKRFEKIRSDAAR